MTTFSYSLVSIGMLAGAALGALAVCYLGEFLLIRLARHLPSPVPAILLRRLRGPTLLSVPAFALLAALPFTDFGRWLRGWIYHGTLLLLIAALGMACIRLFDAWRDTLAQLHRIDTPDNLHARQILTQVTVLRRVAVGMIGSITVAVMLMTFPQVRAIGTTLFASAGAAGLLLGLAARPAMTNVLAGLQVALTEPIRLDDVVVVEGEWGRIEEIRTAYVVVRIWDQRRLVLPLSYFIEKPFENWTRRTADLLATVTVYVDYSAPVDVIRTRLQAILRATRLWDGKSWNLQVTDASPQTLELRALMSAANSGDAWDLRCLVREELIRFLQQEYPGSLPRTRVALQGPTGVATDAGDTVS